MGKEKKDLLEELKKKDADFDKEMEVYDKEIEVLKTNLSKDKE
ncbi:hypothetical protein [Rossellomorea vietnamensis]|nr:hypothetical protein [Rossellomorea vietnamensis]